MGWYTPARHSHEGSHLMPVFFMHLQQLQHLCCANAESHCLCAACLQCCLRQSLLLLSVCPADTAASMLGDWLPDL